MCVCFVHYDDNDYDNNIKKIMIMMFMLGWQHLYQTNAKGGVAAWPDVPKPGATLGNLTPADRHGSVQVSCS